MESDIQRASPAGIEPCVSRLKVWYAYLLHYGDISVPTQLRTELERLRVSHPNQLDDGNVKGLDRVLVD